MTATPPLSSLSLYLTTAPSFSAPTHAPALHALALQVQHNLEFQHDWTSLHMHTHSPIAPYAALPRPLISGKPPRRVYIHPDEQIELIKAGVRDEDAPSVREWVLPSRLAEKWSLRMFGEVFDGLGYAPPWGPEEEVDGDGEGRGVVDRWREQCKRVMLATVDDDSTVVYYVVHDGIVKPRQN